MYTLCRKLGHVFKENRSVRSTALGGTLVGMLFASLMCAQTNEGILAGTILDQSGAAIQGAQVTAKNEATAVTYNTTSGPDGGFRFPSLPIGKYDVTATESGFTTQVQTGVEVQIATTTAIKLTLSVGKTETQLTVEATATPIQTESSDIGTVITSEQTIELPLALGGVGAMRSPEAFVFLAPGTSGPGTAGSNNGIFISKIGGGQSFGSEVLLDGLSTLRTENGSSFDEAAPSVETIAEFRVITSLMPAQYGRTTSAVETFGSKSGTNAFHGTAYDILQNDDLDANGRFANAAGSPRGPNKKNDYGGNLGGPVIIPKLYNGKDKTFFFFNWEQYNQHIGGTNTSFVPTAAERNGDFSSSLTSNLLGYCGGPGGIPVYQGEIFDPTTTFTAANGDTCRKPFANNTIPSTMFSQVSKNYLNYLPAPNGTFPNGQNYSISSSSPLQNTTYNVRIDESISEKSKFFANYDSRENARYIGGTVVLPGPADPNGWHQDFITHYGRAGWDYIFTPTLLNHLAIGYNRTNSQNYTTGALQAQAGNFSWTSKLGITGISGIEFPIVGMGEDVPQIGRANADANVDNGERFEDTVSWSKGNHNLTMGFDFRNQLYATYAFDTDTGVYNFGRGQTAGGIGSTNFTANSGNGIASFLLGDLANGNAFEQGHVPRWTFQYYAAFIQDDWKVRPHLTLNLGLRWDVDVPRKESHNDTSNFDPTAPNPAAGGRPGAMVFGSTCSGCNPRWADTKYHDVGPRLGFAYNPNGGRMVLRGGYGIVYSPLQYTDFGGSQVQGYSATPTFNSNNGLNAAFNWDNGFPSFAPPPFTNPSVVNTGNPNYIQPRFGQPGIIQQWSFQIQEQVGKDMVATLGYVGNRAQNLRSALMNANNIPLGDLNLGYALGQSFVGNSLGVGSPYPTFLKDWGNGVSLQQALRPFPQYSYIYTDVLQNIGQSTFNSLQATLEKRMSNGLSLQSSFTWEKILTDADSILPGINGGIAQIQNPDNLSDEKALSSQDVPFTFTTSFLYQLPFGKGKAYLTHGLAGAVLGGWEIGGVLRYQSGTPISFGCAAGIPGWDNCVRFDRGSGSLFSDVYKNGTFDPTSANAALTSAFNPKCNYLGQSNCSVMDPNTTPIAQGSTVTLQQERGGAYYLGNMPRNNADALWKPYINEDFSVLRNFRLHESATFQLKAEFLNAFNRTVFSMPDASPNDPNYGKVFGTIDAPRVVQFTGRITF